MKISTENNIQKSTASTNHRQVPSSKYQSQQVPITAIIASSKENGKNQKKLSNNQLNSKISAKTQVNSNFGNKKRDPPDQDEGNSESEEITEQCKLKILHRERPCTIKVEDSSVKHLHGKTIANKTSIDYIYF